MDRSIDGWSGRDGRGASSPSASLHAHTHAYTHAAPMSPIPQQVSEIKAELELRGVSYAGVFERNELETLLLDARIKGKARPEILDQFNEAKQ